MLGDINIAEPGALIGFAGPRVVKETIGKDLPEGFQTAEFVLEHGFLDFIVERKDLKDKIHHFLSMIKN
jgi:acetyl-CoA carboxylase carboxyl transferase subunit beta